MKYLRTTCAVFAGALAVSGCSTSYAPRPSPRVAVVMQGGTPGYAREGKVYPGGGFGGDIDEAVRGNPEAEAHANAYRANMIGGFAATLAGVASFVGGGMLYFANSDETDRDRDATAQAAGGVLAIGGVAAYVTGLVLITTAQPHLWDAINLYNDGVYDPGVPPRPYGPYAAPPYGPMAPPGAAPYGTHLPAVPPVYGPSGPAVAPPFPGGPAPSSSGPNAPAPPAPIAPPTR